MKKADRKTDEILASLGLSDKADAYVRQLSGGHEAAAEWWPRPWSTPRPS